MNLRVRLVGATASLATAALCVTMTPPAFATSSASTSIVTVVGGQAVDKQLSASELTRVERQLERLFSVYLTRDAEGLWRIQPAGYMANDVSAESLAAAAAWCATPWAQ